MKNQNVFLQALFNKAKATLEANFVSTEVGSLLAAGGNHFRSLWVRDFCHSVPGLLALGHSSLVERQLQLIYKHRRADFVLPRGLDVVPPQLRVLWNLLLQKNPWWMGYEGQKLKPEYMGEHQTIAYDSNLLFILAAEQLELYKKTQFQIFSKENLRALLQIYRFNSKGLLEQPAFSDWQDSARRKGSLLFTHLLYLKAARFLDLHEKADSLLDLVFKTFFDSQQNLFFERVGASQISLESHLFLLKGGLFDKYLNSSEIYQTLKAHPLWTSTLVPGKPIFPTYESSEISWTTRMVGLRHYHDGFIWGWLTAEAYAQALQQNDLIEAERILNCFSRSMQSAEFLGEIYLPEGTLLKPVRTIFYRSENPFSWTAAKWAEALSPNERMP